MNGIFIRLKKNHPEWMTNLNYRLLVKIGRSRIVLPDNAHKRTYLGNRRYRELLSYLIDEGFRQDIRTTPVYFYHAPKSIRKYVDSQPVQEIKVAPIPVMENKPLEKKSSFLKRIFGFLK